MLAYPMSLASELSAALTLWRTLRRPELAHVVCAMGAACPRELGLVGRSARAGHERWCTAARGAADEHIDELIETLTETSSARQAGQRLLLLRARGPDPRLAVAVQRWLDGQGIPFVR